MGMYPEDEKKNTPQLGSCVCTLLIVSVFLDLVNKLPPKQLGFHRGSFSAIKDKPASWLRSKLLMHNAGLRVLAYTLHRLPDHCCKNLSDQL
jgi:hypothetical protein